MKILSAILVTATLAFATQAQADHNSGHRFEKGAASARYLTLKEAYDTLKKGVGYEKALNTLLLNAPFSVEHGFGLLSVTSETAGQVSIAFFYSGTGEAYGALEADVVLSHDQVVQVGTVHFNRLQ